MKFLHPTRRRLALTWAVLMALTVLSMVTGRAGYQAGEALGPLAVAVVLFLTVFKATRVLNVYLNLGASSPGWRRGFLAILLVICGIVLTAYVIAENIQGLKGGAAAGDPVGAMEETWRTIS